jgi:septal ring factor EnvC (AmiA/AmiB activator)
MKFVAKLALVAAVGLALAGCNDKAKQDLLKCQEEGQKITAELTTVKAELDAAKVAATDLQTKFDTLTQERDALLAKVAEFEAAAAAAAEADAAKPAPKPAAKKPAEPAKPAPITTSTGVKPPPVESGSKGIFQKKKQ